MKRELLVGVSVGLAWLVGVYGCGTSTANEAAADAAADALDSSDAAPVTPPPDATTRQMSALDAGPDQTAAPSDASTGSTPLPTSVRL